MSPTKNLVISALCDIRSKDLMNIEEFIRLLLVRDKKCEMRFRSVDDDEITLYYDTRDKMIWFYYGAGDESDISIEIPLTTDVDYIIKVFKEI